MDETASSADSVPLEGIHLPVNFGLGSAVIPLGELEAIQPGYLFELDADVNKPVRIEVHGKLIGLGQLVLVDGKLAVRYQEKA